MEPIRDIVKRVIHNTSEKNTGFEFQLQQEWGRIAGAEVLKHTKLQRFSQGTVVVLVDQATWMYEIRSRHYARILKHLQMVFGTSKVKRIVLTIGSF